EWRPCTSRAASRLAPREEASARRRSAWAVRHISPLRASTARWRARAAHRSEGLISGGGRDRSMVRLTFCVPTWNGAGFLPTTLCALLAVPGAHVQGVVGDDASADRAAAAARP